MKTLSVSQSAPVASIHLYSASRAFVLLLLLLGSLFVSPVRTELSSTCLEIYIGTGAVPVGPNATFQELLDCETTAANFHSNMGNYYCKNHTDEYCGTACPADIQDIHLCFIEDEEDEEKEQGDDCDGEGNPCNPASGNKYQTEEDYRSYDGRLELVRSYNSLSPTDGPFGYGWRAPSPGSWWMECGRVTRTAACVCKPKGTVIGWRVSTLSTLNTMTPRASLPAAPKQAA